MASKKSLNHKLDLLFSALADSTRRNILERLQYADASVSELAEPYDMSLPAVLKHLRVLEEAGLISQEKSGRVRHVQLEAKEMQAAAIWIEKYKAYWQGQFDSLERYLAREETESRKKKEK